jgi:hypothetical protein
LLAIITEFGKAEWVLSAGGILSFVSGFALRIDRDRQTDQMLVPERKECQMFDRLKSKTAIATAASLIAALGVGGVAVAQNSGSGVSSSPQATAAAVKSSEIPGKESKAPDNSQADQDNVQAGDQSGADKGTSDSSASDQETNDAPDGQQSGSDQETNDGPGGHADQTGNSGADHEASGQE